MNDSGVSVPPVPVRPSGPARRAGKTRNPWIAWLLSFTIVYWYIWYFKINKELRDYSEQIDVQPGMAVVAVLFGAILIGIPPIVSWFHTASRIQKAQKLSGSQARCSGLLGFLLNFLLGLGVVYYQSQLNTVWAQHGNPEAGTILG